MTLPAIDIGHGVSLKDERRDASSCQLPSKVIGVFQEQAEKFAKLGVTEIKYTAIPKWKLMGIEMPSSITVKTETQVGQSHNGDLERLYEKISDGFVRCGGNFSTMRNLTSYFGSPCYVAVAGAFPDPS